MTYEWGIKELELARPKMKGINEMQQVWYLWHAKKYKWAGTFIIFCLNFSVNLMCLTLLVVSIFLTLALFRYLFRIRLFFVLLAITIRNVCDAFKMVISPLTISIYLILIYSYLIYKVAKTPAYSKHFDLIN
jgi:hypothetical protein